MNVSKYLNSDDEGSSNGSGDDNLVESFNIAQPPPLAAAEAPLMQKQVPEYENIMEAINDFNAMNSDINILFLIFNRINLALDNKTLTESQADSLYRNITELCTFGNVNLTLAQVTEIGKMFKNASQGTTRDLDLLTLELLRTGSEPEIVVNKIDDAGENSMLSLDRVFDSEKGVASMMRLCRTLAQLNLKSDKCAKFYSRLQSNTTLQTGQPIHIDSITKMSEKEINLNEFGINEFAIVIQEMIRQRRSHVREEEERQRARTQREQQREQQRRQLERQQHEDNVMKARLRFHKGGTVIQKKQYQSKKYKPKNIRKSKYNKPKCTRTHKKYCKNKTKKHK
jgi:hypothetical protein